MYVHHNGVLVDHGWLAIGLVDLHVSLHLRKTYGEDMYNNIYKSVRKRESNWWRGNANDGFARPHFKKCL